jgi:hypothetical protein
MAIFRRSSPGDLDRMRAEILRLSEAMNRQERAAAAASAAAAEAATAPIVVPADDPGWDPADLIERLDALAEQVGALELRVSAVATELANQVSELGTEIDALARRPAGEPIDDEVLDGLRDAQSRLANEQARYQIAFRADLARLAERIPRS